MMRDDGCSPETPSGIVSIRPYAVYIVQDGIPGRIPYIIVEGQLSRATVWGINYPVGTSGRIRSLRTHARYTVLVVGRGPFATSGRILSFRTHAWYTVEVVGHILFLEFKTHPITQDACMLYGSVVDHRLL